MLVTDKKKTFFKHIFLTFSQSTPFFHCWLTSCLCVMTVTDCSESLVVRCGLNVMNVQVCTVLNCLLGGFLEFQANHPSLCQSQSAYSTSTATGYKCPPLTSMSQPCLPVSNVGPTKILPFLFLGSQQDALSQETMQVILMMTVMLVLRRGCLNWPGHLLLSFHLWKH